MRHFFVLIYTFCCLASFADVIVMKDGSSITVFNVEEAGKWILYTESADMNSDLKRISIDEVFAIKQDDGEMHIVGQKETSETNDTLPATQNASKHINIAPNPAADNVSFIEKYNTSDFTKIRKPANNKKLKYGDITSIWGISENSILCDQNITVFINPTGPRKYSAGINNWTLGYEVSIFNRSNDLVYIDLIDSFRIDNGISKSFYDGRIITTSSQSSQGGSVNLGGVSNALGIGGALGAIANGVTIGSGNSNSIQTSEVAQPIISIPPQGTVILPLEKVVDGNKIFELGDVFTCQTISQDAAELGLYEWGVVSVNNFLPSYSYIITYSKDNNFSTYTQLPIHLYLRGILGVNTIIGNGEQNYECEPFQIVGYGKVTKSDNKNSGSSSSKE